MNYDKALDKGYLIVVGNRKTAENLNRKHKNARFVSINSHYGSFDGAKGLFIDQFISEVESKKIDELQKLLPNVHVGPLYSEKIINQETNLKNKIESHDPPIKFIERK